MTSAAANQAAARVAPREYFLRKNPLLSRCERDGARRVCGRRMLDVFTGKITCIRRRFSVRHAGAAPHYAVAELGSLGASARLPEIEPLVA